MNASLALAAAIPPAPVISVDSETAIPAAISSSSNLEAPGTEVKDAARCVRFGEVYYA
jgi:hypothetical protein